MKIGHPVSVLTCGLHSVSESWRRLGCWGNFSIFYILKWKRLSSAQEVHIGFFAKSSMYFPKSRRGPPHHFFKKPPPVVFEITSRSSTPVFSKSPLWFSKSLRGPPHQFFCRKPPVVSEITSRSSTSVVLRKAPCGFQNNAEVPLCFCKKSPVVFEIASRYLDPL